MKKAFVYASRHEACDLDFMPINCHLWAEEYPFFVRSEAEIYAVECDGIGVVLKTDEPCPKAVYKHRDDPVCNDSCMEFFFQPFCDDERYLNFEINPNGACLSAIGKDRYDRVFLKELSAVEPEVSVIAFDEGWGVKLFISERLISDAFGRKFSVSDTEFIRANFYKCGDETPSPHYASAFPVVTATPDFHRPEYFEKIYFLHE